MIASLAWKEYREQRSIWLALALIGGLVIVLLPMCYFPGPSAEKGFRESLQVVAVALAWTYGLVSGAMLMAGEAEAGTQLLLDSLPSSRLGLWAGKVMAGLALVAFLALLMAMLVLFAGLWGEADWWLGGAALAAAGPHGLAWGMACSSRARSVLGAVGLALLCNLLVLPAVTFAVTCGGTVVAYVLHLPSPGWLLVVVWGALTLLLPLPISALTYTRLDRARLGWEVTRPVRDRFGGAWRQAAWLSWRQMRGLVPGLMVFGFVAGFLALSRGLVVWPVVTLGIGALCGVTAFMDEQAGAHRFLGDQRFPLGVLWMMKVGTRLGLGFVVLVVMLAPALIVTAVQEAYRPSNSHELPQLVNSLGGPVLSRAVPLGVFFAGPLVTGLAVGHLVGLLLRKALVALVVAMGVGALLVALWWPSMLAGGLHGWQVFLPALVLLGGAWLLVPYWAGDRLVSWGAVARLFATGALTLTVTAVGLTYRVVEYPDVAEPAGLAAWEAGLPTPEKNEGGRLVRRGLEQLHALRQSLNTRRPAQPLFAGMDGAQANGASYQQQAQEALRRGWPGPRAELGGWLDEAFNHGWHQELAKAALLPPGTVVSPRPFNLQTAWRTYDSAGAAGVLLAARGLQRQRECGDPAAFVDHLQTGLALSRHISHNANYLGLATGRQVERNLLLGVERWLENLGNKPDLIRRAVDVVRAHVTSAPVDLEIVRWVEYINALDGLDRPVDWLGQGNRPVLGLGGEEQDVAVITAAWSLPWERARRERLTRLAYWGEDQFPPNAIPSLNATVPTIVPMARNSRLADKRPACRRSAVLLVLALRLYLSEKGRPAGALEELVPDYIPAVPVDPFSGRPFRYRVSKGEAIDFAGPIPPGGAKLTVARGQGLVWSVGEDRQDNDARLQARDSAGTQSSGAGEDLIWVVPSPSK